MFVAAGGSGGQSGGEVLRRASDGDILTGSSRSSGGAAKEAKYDCPFCGKRFNRPSSLKVLSLPFLPLSERKKGTRADLVFVFVRASIQIHTYSHTGEKPFVCTHSACGRKFSVQSNLK